MAPLRWRSSNRLIWAAPAAAALALLGLAARADLAAPHASVTTVTADLTVGTAFLVAGVAFRGPRAAQALLVGVGGAWLVASMEPVWGGLHQGLLLLTLAVAGRLSSRRVLMVVTVVLAVPIAVGLLTQEAVGACFMLLATTLAALPRRGRHRAWAVPTASAMVGLTLMVHAWLAEAAPDWTDPTVTLLVYEGVLVAAVALLVLASGVTSTGTPLTGRLLTDAGASGTDGLSAVLAHTLGDPSLRVLPPREDGSYGSARAIPVDDDGRTVAVIAYRSAPLDDPATADAATAAVRMVLTHDGLLAQQERQLHELEETRSRILAATDRQRAVVASALRDDVTTLERVRDWVGSLPTDRLEPDDTMALVSAELALAGREILGLVAGVPPTELGDGRLGPALGELARRAPVRMAVDVPDDLAAPAAVETTAYFVCAEAVTNAVKHARAAQVGLAVRADPDGLEVTVVDDGIGGADLGGNGLQGLAARVAAVRGRLRVVSPRGAGTTVSAWLPFS